nr:ribonuclease H-like domain-containing protein [Tanacetum cinerariifolium]
MGLIEFILEPINPKLIPLEDEILPAEEQLLPDADPPTADSPGYIPESDPEEDPKEDDEDPKVDLADYPTNRDDDDEDKDEEEKESSGDEADDEEEDKNKHYALWEVIKFGDSYKSPQEEAGKDSASESSAKKKGRTVVITTDDTQKRRNDAEGSETLEQTFNRLQAIVSHLEFIDVEIKQHDLNQKFFTSLAPEWLMYTIVRRNRDDLDTMSLDDVYNHLKVYELKVQKKSESNSQNMAFISSANTSSGKAASISYDTVCAYIASQSNGSQIEYEDITQIDEDDIKEIDIKPSPSIESNTSDLQNSNSSVFEHRESSSSIMSKPMIKFVKAADSPTVIKTNKVETARKSPVKYVEMYRNTSKSPKVRGNQRNWNNLKSQQLGKDFLMKNKACFKCGHFDHLAYDCGVWVEKRKTWPKNNIAHKNVKPRAVLLKTARTPIAVNRTNMNVAQPKRTSFAKSAHSYVRRPFQRKSAVRTQFQVPRVSTITKKFPTVDSKFSTVKSTFTAGLGDKGKAVKASACWIWRPKQNTT